jgi:pimeloyl-ACP methyl ester carboxylesterase
MLAAAPRDGIGGSVDRAVGCLRGTSSIESGPTRESRRRHDLSGVLTFLSMHLHRLGTAGPQVVLIHGIPGSAQGWMPVAELLSEDHRVCVPDLLGFGASPTPPGIDAGAQAAALEHALAAASVEKATIVGHDFGGPIALSLYERHPHLFQALALMATNAFPDTPIPFPLNTVAWRIVGTGIARVLFSKLALRAMLWRYGGNHVSDATSVRRIFTESLQELDARYRAYPSILQRVEVPTLVVWGDKDPFFPLEIGRRTAALGRDFELAILEGGGHFLPEQLPVEVASAIRDLASRATSATSHST